MASSRSTVDHFVDLISGAGAVSARAMFGEFGVYCDGKMVAMVCDDTVFVKPTPEGRAFAGPMEEAPPYPGAKPCLKPSAAQLDDGAWLSELVRITTRSLPAPKPKKTAKKPPR